MTAADPIDNIVRIIREIAEGAADVLDFRHRLSERVAAGDLDDAIEAFKAANKRAKDFIESGE